MEGGSYSKEDIRELVEHARKWGVTVEPEIELPGHCFAALAAYPNLWVHRCCHRSPPSIGDTLAPIPLLRCFLVKPMRARASVHAPGVLNACCSGDLWVMQGCCLHA